MSEEKQSSVADRISAAVGKLIAENKPVTRKAIAELAGCQLRTVSMYKSIWKDSAPPFINSPQSLTSPFTKNQRFFEQIIDHLEKEDLQTMELPTLEAHIAKVKFYADCSKFFPLLNKRIEQIGRVAQKTWKQKQHE